MSANSMVVVTEDGGQQTRTWDEDEGQGLMLSAEGTAESVSRVECFRGVMILDQSGRRVSHRRLAFYISV